MPEATRPDISANLPREMRRAGLRRGEDVARAEAAETKIFLIIKYSPPFKKLYTTKHSLK